MLSRMGKLMSCWTVAAISGQLLFFPSGRKPLIYVLHLDFNHRLWVWVLNDAPMLNHAAILLPPSRQRKTEITCDSGHLFRALYFAAVIPVPPSQHSGFLGCTEAPCSLLTANHIFPRGA